MVLSSFLILDFCLHTTPCPLPPFLFFVARSGNKKKLFKSSPCSSRVLPTQERAADTSCLPLSLSFYLNFLPAKQNYLYRQSVCHPPKSLCKCCRCSGAPAPLGSPAPRRPVSKRSTGKTSLPFRSLPSCQPPRARRLTSSPGSGSDCVRTRHCLERHHGNEATRQTGRDHPANTSFLKISQAQASCDAFLHAGREQLGVYPQY